jgi:hypothetical protein
MFRHRAPRFIGWRGSTTTAEKEKIMEKFVIYTFGFIFGFLLLHTFLRGVFDSNLQNLKGRLRVKDDQIAELERTHSEQLRMLKREWKVSEAERELDLEARERDLEIRTRELLSRSRANKRKNTEGGGQKQAEQN